MVVPPEVERVLEYRRAKLAALVPVVLEHLKKVGLDARDPDVLDALALWGRREMKRLAEFTGINEPSAFTWRMVIDELRARAPARRRRRR